MRPRFDYQQPHVVLSREGWAVRRNKVQIRPLHQLGILKVRMSACRKKRISPHRESDADRAGGTAALYDELAPRPVGERTEVPGLDDPRQATSTVRRALGGLVLQRNLSEQRSTSCEMSALTSDCTMSA